MKIGLIGRGPWGNVYAKTMTEMGIDFIQMGKDWTSQGFDGMIIASHPHSHFMIAKSLIGSRMPVIIEKPVCFTTNRALSLLESANNNINGIALVGYTRLYSPVWKAFKASLPKITSLTAEAGSKCKIDPKWDWGSHLVAMCFDLGFNPEKADIKWYKTDIPLKITVNDEFTFTDMITDPMPLNVLISEFVDLIESKRRNLHGLEIALEVTNYLEKH